MATRANAQSRARRQAGKQLMDIIESYGLELKHVAKETGIDLVTLRNLKTFTPHLQTIGKISAYLEDHAKAIKANRVKKLKKKSKK
jgi:hypothetical protein